jgi:cellulose synthase operon protein C
VALEETEKHVEAGAIYDIFIAEFPQSELITEVRMRKAETILRAGDFAAAAKIFGEVAAVPNFAMADHAMFRQAYCLTRLNQLAEAAALYGKLVETFPKSERVNISDATLAAGRCYYRADKLPEASDWFLRVRKLQDNNAYEAAHWECRIFLKTQQAAKAEELAAKYLPSAVDKEYLVALKLDQADAVYEQPAKRADSVALYAKIAAEHAQHALASQALYNAAFTALELKKFPEGSQHATEFFKAYPQDKLLPDVKYVAAECLLQQNKAPEAEAAYKELIASHGMHAEINVWKIRHALALYLQKKYAEVIAALSPLELPVAEQKAEAQYLIGVSHFYSDKFAEAEKALELANQTAPKWRQADETLLVLSRARRKLENTKGAQETVSKLIAEFPESKLLDQAHYRLGEYHYAVEDFKNALAEYDLLLKNYPQSTFVPFALYGKGWSHIKLKEFAPASQAFSTLLEKYPDHSLVGDTKFARSMSRRLEGNFQASVEDATAFLATNPQGNAKADILYERGLAEVGLNKNDAAVVTFEAILKEHPQYAGLDKVLYELGWANKTLNKAEPALANFAKLSTDFPMSPLAGEAFFHVAEDQYTQKKYPEALKTYAQAKERAGQSELGEKSTYKLGWSNYQLKQYEPAFKEFSEQLQKYPQGPLVNDALFMQGEALFKQDKYAEALPVFQKALQVKLSNPAMEVLAYLHGGQSASQLKQWDAAIQLLTEVPKRFPESPYVAESYYETGYAHQNANKPEEALKQYAIAAEKSRGEVGARARFMSGEVFFTQQKYKEAIQEFQRGMYGFGGENATPEVKNWQAKCGYEAGRCCEVQIATATDATVKAKLITDGKKFYTFAAEKLPEAPVGAEAKKRLEVLSKL